MTNEALICQRMMLEVLLDEPQAALLALNDCVIHAGPPFRVIELDVQVDGEHLTTISGDGLIVATPGGSTAHNMSAGGPILQPGIRAFVLTPLSPHSLTHRPLVVEYDASIYVSVSQANPGTVVSIDGQLTTPLQAGAGLTIKRSPIEFPLIRNPKNNCFHTLVTKLQWGRCLSGRCCCRRPRRRPAAGGWRRRSSRCPGVFVARPPRGTSGLMQAKGSSWRCAWAGRACGRPI